MSGRLSLLKDKKLLPRQRSFLLTRISQGLLQRQALCEALGEDGRRNDARFAFLDE